MFENIKIKKQINRDMYEITSFFGNDYYFIILLAFLYFLLNKFTLEKLVTILIIALFYHYIQKSIEDKSKIADENNTKVIKSVENDVKDNIGTNTENFYIKEYKKNVKYLLRKPDMVKIIKNLNFVKKFNVSRYANLINLFDKFIKVYIYILSDRYDLNTYLPIFNDIRSEILEIIYSLIFIIPERFKHSYGFDPHIEINKSCENFIKISNGMLNVLKKYGIVEKKEVFINSNKYKPYENDKNLYLP